MPTIPLIWSSSSTLRFTSKVLSRPSMNEFCFTFFRPETRFYVILLILFNVDFLAALAIRLEARTRSDDLCGGGFYTF